MGILLNVLSGLTGIAIMLIVFNLYIALRSRDPINYAFVVIGVGMLIYIPCNSLLYQVTTPSEYLHILKIQMYGTLLYHIGLIILFGHYLNLSIKWPLAVYSSLLGFFLLVRQINPMITYTSFSGMTEYMTIWHEILYLPVAETNIWGYLYATMIFSIYFYLLAVTVRQIRTGGNKNTLRVLIAVIVLIFAILNDYVVYIFNLQWLFIADVSLVVVTVIMEMILTDDAIRVNVLTRELNELNDHLEDRIQLRTSQLEETNRELESFTYSVSQDLRAPLRVISGYTKIIRNEFKDTLPPNFYEYFQKIEQASTRMSALIDALLEIARISKKTPRRVTFDAESLVRSLVYSLSSSAENRNIEWEIGNIPVLSADPVLMRQVFANLLENAVKFSQNNPSAEIEISSFDQDGKTIYFVRDNGVGFNMEYADKVFMLFQRLHREDEFEGHGVGLAITKRIIQLHGGRIWCESHPDEGATFYFDIKQGSM